MKSFTTTTEQIQILQGRGLLFSDTERAKDHLMSYGYYEIVNGYKDTLLASKDPDKFKKGATFDQLFALYQMDKEFQYTVFQATLDLEKNLKTALGYSIAERYGVDQKRYMARTNYRSGDKIIAGKNKGRYEIDVSLAILKDLSKSNTQPYQHYREKHNHIPPWILFKGLTFGQTYHFLRLQKSEIKNSVQHILTGLPLELFQEQSSSQSSLSNLFFDTMSLAFRFRNQSAHGGRIYNYRPHKVLIRYNPFLHPRLRIDPPEYRLGFGQRDLFTLMGALSFLKNPESFLRLTIGIDFHLKKYTSIYPVERDPILKALGLHEKQITTLSNPEENFFHSLIQR